VGIKEEKAQLQAQFESMKTELEKTERRLQKLDKVQDIPEPGPGTVLRFSRPLAGSSQKYTFVAFRFGVSVESWVLTGRSNALRLLGLTEKGNSWEDLLLAIGDNKIEYAVSWSKNSEDAYEYFQGSSSGRIFRTPTSDPSRVEVRMDTGRWRHSSMMDRSYLVRNPGSYNKVSAEEVNAS
jgi:hypothetical protein